MAERNKKGFRVRNGGWREKVVFQEKLGEEEVRKEKKRSYRLGGGKISGLVKKVGEKKERKNGCRDQKRFVCFYYPNCKFYAVQPIAKELIKERKRFSIRGISE